MNLSTTALILVLLLLAWLFIRWRQGAHDAPARKPERRVSHKGTEFHAVSIKFAGNACKAAREMEGRRFLSSAAPKLPLPECDVLECSCRFAHHKDRRTGKDRRSPFGPSGFGGGTGSYEAEQRQGRDRRTDEEDEEFF